MVKLFHILNLDEEKMTNKIWNLENKQMEFFSGNYDKYIDRKKNAVIEETSPILRKTRK